MADGISYERARYFRRHLTPPEARLWTCLKGDRLAGLGFRKQHPIGPYILDFYCAKAKLAVEVDGAGHDTEEQIAHDRRKTAWLARKGLRVVRIRAVDVRDELDGVLGFIRRVAEERVRERSSRTESPPPSRREEAPRHLPIRSANGEENAR